jgi:hypothetical protein
MRARRYLTRLTVAALPHCRHLADCAIVASSLSHFSMAQPFAAQATHR